MTVPSNPYVTAEQVNQLTRNLTMKTGSFDNTSTVPLATVEQYITWVSSQVDINFSQAGYVVPLVAISGETWPVHQTYYLQLLTALGVCSLIWAGLKPAPATGPGQTGAPSNVFETMFNKELQKVYDGTKTHLRFRAAYYIGTPAELVLQEPIRPKSDFMEGYFDQGQYMNLWDYTEMMQTVNDDMVYNQSKWDYMYDLLETGYGY